MELYNILSESNTDLRQPVGLEEQLLKDDALDSEVGQSMLQLLQVLLAESSAGAHVASAKCSHDGGLASRLLGHSMSSTKTMQSSWHQQGALSTALLSCPGVHTCTYLHIAQPSPALLARLPRSVPYWNVLSPTGAQNSWCLLTGKHSHCKEPSVL